MNISNGKGSLLWFGDSSQARGPVSLTRDLLNPKSIVFDEDSLYTRPLFKLLPAGPVGNFPHINYSLEATALGREATVFAYLHFDLLCFS